MYPHRAEPRDPMASWHRWSHQVGVGIRLYLIPHPEGMRTGKSPSSGKRPLARFLDVGSGPGNQASVSRGLAEVAGGVRWPSCGEGSCVNWNCADHGQARTGRKRLQSTAHSGIRLEVWLEDWRVNWTSSATQLAG